jgi:hypothetical protein
LLQMDIALINCADIAKGFEEVRCEFFSRGNQFLFFRCEFFLQSFELCLLSNRVLGGAEMLTPSRAMSKSRAWIM